MSAESDRIDDAQKAMQTAIEEADFAAREALQKRAAEIQKELSEERVKQARRDADFQTEVADALEAEQKAEAEADENDEEGPQKDMEDEILEATSDTIADVRVHEASTEDDEFVAPGESSLPESRQVTDADASEDDKPARKPRKAKA